jgi:prephenate dehydratase
LARQLPGALQLPTNSTAEAARLVRGSRFRGAIASKEAAADHGLEVLAYPINDVPGNCTRFLMLRRGGRRLEGPIASLAFSLHANRPGALLEALGCFSRHGLNMTRIESRPSKREMGEYIFFVDLELPTTNSELAQALAELEPLCGNLVHFGAYPLTNLALVEGAA